MRKIYLVASNGSETFGEESITKLKTETAAEFRIIIADLCVDYARQFVLKDIQRSGWSLYTLTILDDRGVVITEKPFPWVGDEPDLKGHRQAIFDAMRH